MSAVLPLPSIQPTHTQRSFSKDEVPSATSRKRSRNDTPEYRNKVQKISKDALSVQIDDIAQSDLCSRGKNIIYRWIEDEDKKLRIAIKKYGLNWKEVATCLPGRDQFACRSRYTNKLREDDWSPATKVEIDMIHKLAKKNKKGEYKWDRICTNFNKAFNKTLLVRPPGFIQKVFDSTKKDYKSYQIENDSPPITIKPSQRPGKKVLSKKRLNKTTQTRKKWNPNEDQQLREAVLEHGEDWPLIASLMPGRTRKNCRSRYINHIKLVDLSPASRAETDLIKQLVQQRLYRHDDGRYKWSAICNVVNKTLHKSTLKRTPDVIKNFLNRSSKQVKRKTKQKSKPKVGSKISASSSFGALGPNKESPKPLLPETPPPSSSTASSLCQPVEVEQRAIVPNVLNKESEDNFPTLSESEPCSTLESLQSFEPIDTSDFSVFEQSLMPAADNEEWQEKEIFFPQLAEEAPMSPLPESDFNINWEREMLSNVVV